MQVRSPEITLPNQHVAADSPQPGGVAMSRSRHRSEVESVYDRPGVGETAALTRFTTSIGKLLLSLCWLCIFSLQVGAKQLNVVATIPDFGAIAQAIGDDKVKVTSICRGTEDAHFVDARPSFIRVLNQADVLLEGGAELEIGWLPPLVNGARNQKILGDAPGHVVLSRGIRLIEVPTGAVDRSMGDVHPLGNPHYWGDPGNGKIIGKTLAAVFSRLDPADATLFEANLKKFEQRLDEKLAEWTKKLAAYRGSKVISYHKSFDYFLERFGFELVGTIEPKPGIEPSPSYINALVSRLKDQKVKLVIIEPFRPRKTPEYLAQALGARLLILPDKVGGNEKAKDEISLFENNVNQITAALSETK